MPALVVNMLAVAAGGYWRGGHALDWRVLLHWLQSQLQPLVVLSLPLVATKLECSRNSMSLWRTMHLDFRCFGAALAQTGECPVIHLKPCIGLPCSSTRALLVILHSCQHWISNQPFWVMLSTLKQKVLLQEECH